MVSFVLALVLLGLALLGVSLHKTYYYVPPKELKRQAENGDKLARSLWRAVAYDTSLRSLLWLWIGLAGAGAFVLLARIAPWWLSLPAVALTIWLAFGWFPRRGRLSGTEAKLAILITPAVAWLLNYVHPAFEQTIGRLVRRYPHEQHTALYDTNDLVELIDRQAAQHDNRIEPADLELVKRALTARQYKVRDVLVPRAQVKSVSDEDTISLVVLDELHASNQASFPVVHGKGDKIVGTLYLHDLDLKSEGRVRDYMVPDARYVHEDDSLQQALQAFFKTKHQLFVVVNSFEEYLGIVTLEQVVGQLTGESGQDGFDMHKDLAAVAGKHNQPEPEAPALSELEPVTVAAADAPETPEVSDLDEDLADETVEEPEEAQVSEPEGSDEAAEPVAAGEAPEEDEPEVAEEEPAAEDDTENAAPGAEAVDPDELAALDLPDEDNELAEGTHVDFKPKKSSTK